MRRRLRFGAAAGVFGLIVAMVCGCGGGGSSDNNNGIDPVGWETGEVWRFEDANARAATTLVFVYRGTQDFRGEQCRILTSGPDDTYIDGAQAFQVDGDDIVQVGSIGYYLGQPTDYEEWYDPAVPTGLPFSTGEEFTYNGTAYSTLEPGGSPMSSEVSVIGSESITVPAGTFQCWKYTFTNENGTVTFWWSDDLGLWCQAEIGERLWQLTSHSTISMSAQSSSPAKALHSTTPPAQKGPLAPWL